MKAFLLAICIIATTISFAQSTDETQIRQMLDAQTKAWNRGDVNGFMKGYWESDSLKFIGKNGITYGWKNTLDNYKKNYPDTTAMGTLIFDLLVVAPLSPDYFNVIGKWKLKRTIGDLQGAYTLLIRKINGHWVIVQDHSS